MPTSYMALPPQAWYPTDDSSGTASAQFSKRVTSDATDPQANWMEWLFDEFTDEHIMTQFVMPGNYASGPVLKVYYKCVSAVAGDTVFEARLMALTDADAQDADADEFAATNASSATTVPGTAGYMDVLSITLTNADSVAAGDHVVLCLNRDVSADGVSGDIEVINCELQYTTT